MRTKQNTQPEFIFQRPSAAEVTREYFAAYDAISLILDEHPEIMTRAHRDLRKPLGRNPKLLPTSEPWEWAFDLT